MISESIRTKIEDRFGRKILYSKDCEALSKSIEKVCNNRISATTLKRLLGFAKSIEQPRIFTLDVLAAYVGYKDWSSLLAKTDKASNFSSLIQSKALAKQETGNDIYLLYHQISLSLTTQSVNTKEVIKLCKQFGKQKEIFPFVIEIMAIAARFRNIQFLKNIFNLPFVFDKKFHQEIDFYFVGQTMGLMLRLYPDIADELIPSFAANKIAQQYFIEWFVDEDYLQGYYGKLLDAYHKQKNKLNADRLFYYCLKYNQALQTGNVIERISWYKKLKSVPINSEIHPIPAGRYLGICIAEESSHYYSNSSPYYQVIHNYVYTNDYERAISFLLYLCRQLFKSRRKDWLVQVLNETENHFKKSHNQSTNHWGNKIENELLIYASYSHHLQGDNKKAQTLIHKINPNLFEPFIYKQIHNDYSEVADMLAEKTKRKSRIVNL